MSTIQLEVPNHVKKAVEAIAQRDGVSPEQLMVVAIAEMVAEQRALDRRNDPRMKEARERLLAVLEKVPSRKSMKGDEIPPKLRKRLEKKFPVLKRLGGK